MKMWMAKFNKYLGNKVDSAAMKATATSRPDWGKTVLQDGSKIIIIKAVQGG